MTLEEIKNNWIEFHPDIDWLIAEVERLQGLQQKWNEEFSRADRHRFMAEQRADKAEAEVGRLRKWVNDLYSG